MKKYLLSLFAIMQLFTASGIAGTTTHVAFSQAITGKGLEEDINFELNRIQKAAIAENKCFEFVSANLYTNMQDDWMFTANVNHFYILYTLSDKTDETNPLITKVAYVSAWTYAGIHENLQEEINTLQNMALSEDKIIHFLDIQMSLQHGIAYLIYEISN